eukprot:Em0007g1391a
MGNQNLVPLQPTYLQCEAKKSIIACDEEVKQIKKSRKVACDEEVKQIKKSRKVACDEEVKQIKKSRKVACDEEVKQIKKSRKVACDEEMKPADKEKQKDHVHIYDSLCNTCMALNKFVPFFILLTMQCISDVLIIQTVACHCCFLGFLTDRTSRAEHVIHNVSRDGTGDSLLVSDSGSHRHFGSQIKRGASVAQTAQAAALANSFNVFPKRIAR